MTMCKEEFHDGDDVSLRISADGHGEQLTDQLLPILAHELYQPLQSILFAVDAAQHIYSDESDARQACDIAQQEAQHMSQIIDDLLDVFCDVHRRVHLNIELVDLATIVSEAIETARPSLTAGSHHFSLSLPPDPVTLMADPARLQQILTNLLTNAAKYTQPGGSICLTADAPDNLVIIRVRDNGKGISPERLAGIFELYQAGDPDYRGLGLGLALVKSLVELHGGTVTAHSQGLGMGSQFVVRLPACGPDIGGSAIPFLQG